MVKKFFKAGLSVALALSITVIPNSAAYAKTTAGLPDRTFAAVTTLSQTAAVPNEIDSVKESHFEETKKLAKTKADTLTSLYGVTSVQYALIDEGNIVLSGVSGVYSKDSSLPLTDTKMYGIGSVSKMFTTAAVLQLVEEGRVSLDTPVVSYIPGFTMADPRYKDITVRMLLNHSSGLMGGNMGNALLFNDNDSTTYNRFLDNLKTERLIADPGEFSVYCNDGFTLAELLVEKVSGLSFTEYIRKNISTPLNLYNTKTPLDNFERNRLVKTYLPGSDFTLPTENVAMIGAGGIYSSALNLCRFAELFMSNSNSSVLDRTLADSMENKEYLNGFWSEDVPSLFTYGLGWDSVNTYPFEEYGIKALSKSGDTVLYHGNLTVLPDENMAVAVLSSGGSSSYNLVLSQELLLSALYEKGSISGIHPDKTYSEPIPAAMPQNLKQFAGSYANTTGVFRIEIQDDGLLTLFNPLAPETGSQQFIYTGNNRFYFSDGSAYITFDQAKNGNTYLYLSGYVTLPGIGQTISNGYQAQKLTLNPITPELKTTWELRTNKNYFPITEKYSSASYIIGLQANYLSSIKDLDGYVLYDAVADENTARANLKIPGNSGRNLGDLLFYKDGDTEYLKVGSTILISEDKIPSLHGSAFSLDIGSDGYAQWYRIEKDAGNKKIEISLSDHASFYVYDTNGACVLSSYVNKQNSLTLPQTGYIVFAGDANAHFDISYVK